MLARSSTFHSALMPAQPRPDRILNGSIPLETLRFGLPIALGMGLQTVFNLVDAYIVSRLTPDVAGPALGAIGICDQLTAIGTILSYGLTTASTAMIAQAHGRGDRAEVRRLAWQSMLAVAALSILFGLLSIGLAGPIVAGAVGAKGKVSELGTEYLRVIGGGSFSIYFLFQLTGIQRALGSAKTPVALLVASNVINLFLAVLFVFSVELVVLVRRGTRRLLTAPVVAASALDPTTTARAAGCDVVVLALPLLLARKQSYEHDKEGDDPTSAHLSFKVGTARLSPPPSIEAALKSRDAKPQPIQLPLVGNLSISLSGTEPVTVRSDFGQWRGTATLEGEGRPLQGAAFLAWSSGSGVQGTFEFGSRLFRFQRVWRDYYGLYETERTVFLIDRGPDAEAPHALGA